MSKLYIIRDWGNNFENNRSRTVEKLSWVAIPNRHDGENYSQIITSKDGAQIFAAWVLLVQVASKCQPRGTLLRGGSRPHDSESLSLKTRAPKIWFEKCFEFLEANTDWLIVQDVADDCQLNVSRLSPDCQACDEEGREGKDGKEGENGRASPSLFPSDKSESEGKGEGSKKPQNPSLEEIRRFCAESEISPADADWFFYKCEGNDWTNNGKKIKKWGATLLSWKKAGYLPSIKNASNGSRGKRPQESLI